MVGIALGARLVVSGLSSLTVLSMSLMVVLIGSFCLSLKLGGVSKSMLALNKSVIKVKESQIKG
ncbi:hypothetical protein, partial [Acinetobacter baumannii]